ncbi:class I SAM-dependent methyltransferase [Arenibacterium sp. CAU 1754]
MSQRLSLACSQGGLVLPDDGPIGVFHPRGDIDLSPLPRDRCVIIQPVFPDFKAFEAGGYTCVAEPGAHAGRFAASVVFIPRAKAQARALVAEAMALTDGPVIVDGAKTDGIDSLWKEARKLGEAHGPISKAHGKLFWLDGDAETVSAWRAPATQEVDGFVTAPGVFSADGIDPASRQLAAALPAKLGRHVVDLGAGWGYLAAHVLADPQIEQVDLVEANKIALNCARQNVTDPRATFHWADALDWRPEGRVDSVIMNPPFHTGRSSDPELGRAFIRAAARILAPSGHLWMVANRHLGYESTLNDCFAQVEEVAGDNRFKILHAARPSRPRR